METTKVKTLNSKLATIQTKLKAKKSRFNGFGKYNYRSAEDILEAVKPFLLELGVSVTINENLAEIAGLPVMESIATISDGKDSIQAYAVVGVDLNQKGMNVPQQFGSASSYGKKYSLGNLFLIDDTADSDATNDHKGNTAKPKLEGAALVKAKAFIESGGSMDAIKKKYDIPTDVLKTL
jgi:hypothetical protein